MAVHEILSQEEGVSNSGFNIHQVDGLGRLGLMSEGPERWLRLRALAAFAEDPGLVTSTT